MAPQRSSTLAAVAVIATVFVTLLTADPATATSRSVNISSVWFLPQEGFPVFYRYFKDRITWFEADAVCQFHHANLVTVDTSVQYDATRAYLKELDIATNVWIGLKRASGSDYFAWTDYKKLNPTGGYWHEQIPKQTTSLCAATDPAADFRWHSLNCGGPQVASFICELPVPTWARKEDGCLLTSLPSLTVVFLPEQGAVELASDCGLDGTRRIACKGQANREEMMRQLSCDRGATSPDDDTGSMSTEVTSSSTGTGTTGARSWTGHSHEPPTRHRRDTDILTNYLTTAVSEEAKTNTSQDSDQLPSTGTIASTEVYVDSSTVTTVKDEPEEMNSVIPEAIAEELTTEKKTTNQEPQLSTGSESSTQTMTEELTYSTTTPSESSTVTPTIDEGFIEVRELEIIAENITGKYVFEAESTSKPQTTVRLETPAEPGKTANASQTESVSTPLTTEVLGNEESPPSVVQEPRNDKNMSSGSRNDGVTSPTDQPTTVSSSTPNSTYTAEFVGDAREEAVSNYSINVDSHKSDEIKSREEVEEELLKEAERKEEEKKFKEEEETRRRQFLPSPLRSIPEPKTTSPPPAPPLVEEYEEPEEVMEPEPEVPARPNRGRRLTRPQPHSFYPYFLNRVLG